MPSRRIFAMLLTFVSFATCYRIVAVSPAGNGGGFLSNKFFFGSQDSVDRLPSPFEFFLQRIQALFSNYVHEDLSRPPTWDKPVYTLSPQDQVYFAAIQGIDTSTLRNSESSTEKLFEIIKADRYQQPVSTVRPMTHSTTHQFDDFEYVDIEDISEPLFEIIRSTNTSYVHITPKTTTTSKKEETTEKFIDPNLELNLTISLEKRIH